MFIGNFADQAGRRPAYIICFVIYIASNIGLALQDSFVSLIVLRCLQSTGISSTVALSAATVADVATKQERGSMMGFVMAGSFMGPAIGPIIGGLLAQYLGWRSIFWFLTIASGVFFLPLLFFMPETARVVVGNGSEPAQIWNRPFVQYASRSKNAQTKDSSDSISDMEPKKGSGLRFPNPLAPLKLVCHVNSLIVLFATGFIMAGNMTVLSSITSVYTELYGLSVLEIGLCYISMGVGSIVASFVAGRFLDICYRFVASRHAPDAEAGQRDVSVPVEKARSMVLVPLVTMGAVMTLAFGWVLQYGVHLAAPETLMFFIGLGLTGSFICASTLLVDLHTSSPAAATASNNLVRSLFSAGASAAIDPMLTTLGKGWSFTIVAFILLGTIPFLMFLWLGKRKSSTAPKDVN